MTQLTVISVGSLKEDYLRAAVNEYEKRLSAFCRVENVTIKEEKIADESDQTAIQAALAAEGEKILSRVPQGAYTMALCIEGEMPDSIGLSQKIGRAVDAGGKICLIIGSSHGLCERVKRAARERISFSRLTFPHQLMRVILLEAVYRSFRILSGGNYHK